MSKYVRLKRGNDWGVEYLAVEPLGPRGMASADRALFKDTSSGGQMVSVRFPDGHISLHDVKLKHHNTTVSDMGNKYEVAYQLPGIIIRHHGIELWLCLDQVDVLL